MAYNRKNSYGSAGDELRRNPGVGTQRPGGAGEVGQIRKNNGNSLGGGLSGNRGAAGLTVQNPGLRTRDIQKKSNDFSPAGNGPGGQFNRRQAPSGGSGFPAASGVVGLHGVGGGAGNNRSYTPGASGLGTANSGVAEMQGSGYNRSYTPGASGLGTTNPGVAEMQGMGGAYNRGYTPGASGLGTGNPGVAEMQGGGNRSYIPGASGLGTTNPGVAEMHGDGGWGSGFTPGAATEEADRRRQELAAQRPGDFSYGDYAESDAVKQAMALLNEHMAGKPGEYESQYQARLDEILDQILNREKFSYDLNGDALYQQYKDQYMLQGQQAMMDTMGQASAMTGGFGSSYGQTAGQQTYQGYLQQLNDRVPELYQLALDQYNQEGQDLYNQYGMYADREAQDYSRYRDSMSDYYTELSRLTEDARYRSEQDYGRYMDRYNMEYGEHRDAVGDWQYERGRADDEYWNRYDRDYGEYADQRSIEYDNYWREQDRDYQRERDLKDDEKWQKEFDEAKRQYDQEYEKQYGPAEPEEPADETTSTPNYHSIVSNIRDMREDGETEEKVKAYLQVQVNKGYITQEDYRAILEGVLPVDFTW